MYNNFVKYCLSHGAYIMPLEIPSEETSHLGICNPSIFIEDDGKIRFILRNVNYALWNSDNENKFNSVYGPLYYITQDNDQHLRTRNFLCELDNGGLRYKLIDTSKCDWEPQWEFVGHEDMRLVRWDGKLYGTGVQRDWNTTGIGRMHLSELDENTGEELSRVRINTPGNVDSYCEKNWMPILDMPYHYVRTCNPLEVVKVNPETGDCEQVVYKVPNENTEYLNTDNMQIRGSSQVISWGEYRIAIVHLCHLCMNEKNQKCGTGYYEQFIVWDRDWNIVKLSEPFRFADYSIEFTNGLGYKDSIFYIPFALQDNTSFMVSVSENIVNDFIFSYDKIYGEYELDHELLLDYFDKSNISQLNLLMGNQYFSKSHYASAMVFYERACEYNTFSTKQELYGCLYMCGLCIAKLGNRDEQEKGIWLRMIDLDQNRSEGYIMLSKYYSWRNLWSDAYTWARIGMIKDNYAFMGEYSELNGPIDGEIEYLKCRYYTEWYQDVEQSLVILRNKTNDKLRVDYINFLLKQITDNKSNKQRIL